MERLWKRGDHVKAIYLLSMIDVISERNGIPFANEYDIYRSYKLDPPLTFAHQEPSKVLPIFALHNIVEGDIDDAV